MIEASIIKTLQIVGIALIGYSCYLLVFHDALLSKSGIEYGIILFGIGCTAQAIRAKRVLHDKSK